MNDHIVFKIIKALPEKEAKALNTRLKNDGRERLLKMARAIIAADDSLTKVQLYQKIFGTKYTKDKDYLLRNELRLMKIELEQYLFDTGLEQEIDYYQDFRNRIIGVRLSHLELPAHAADYFETGSEFALKNLRYEESIELDNIAFSHRFKTTQLSAQLLPQMENSYKRTLKTLEELIAFRKSYLEFIHALYGRMSATVAQEKLHILPGFEHLSTPASPLSAQFYTQKAKAYSSFEEADFEKLLEIARQLPAAERIQHEYLSLLGQYASILSMKGKFEEAHPIFREVTEAPNFHRFRERAPFYVNYVRNTIKLKQYQTALDIIAAIENEVSESILHIHLITLKASCYIYLKDLKNLKRILPADFSEIKEVHRNYFKLLYAIYFYLEGNLPMAIHELENMLKTKELKGGENLYLFSTIMLKIFRLVEKKPNGIDVATRKKIVALLDVPELDAQGRSMVPFIWLNDEFNH
jgi:tetratricopeptide (TPR) repeat protein